MKLDFLNNRQRDTEYVESSEDVFNHNPISGKEKFLYPLSLTEWIKEFRVSSRFEIDTTTEEEIKQLLLETEKRRKDLIINNAIRYNRNNQNKYIS